MDEPCRHGQPLAIAGWQQTAFGLRIQIEALQHGLRPLGELAGGARSDMNEAFIAIVEQGRREAVT